MASSQREEIPITNEGMGQPLSATNQVLTAGAAVTQVRPQVNSQFVQRTHVSRTFDQSRVSVLISMHFMHTQMIPSALLKLIITALI